MKQAKHGFDGIILTPHYIESYYEVNQEKRRAWLDALSAGCEQKNIGISLYLGNEIYFTENILNLIKEEKASTINNSRYVLFEFPLNAKPIGIEDIIYSLLEHQYIPILAHPERYCFTQEDPNIIYKLAETGVLMQSNYGSIIGQYGKKAQIIVEKLLENNLVSFLGSDAHRAKTIYQNIDSAIDKIKTIIGQGKFDEISHYNPMKVLKNERIELEYDPKPIKFTLAEKMKMNFNK